MISDNPINSDPDKSVEVFAEIFFKPLYEYLDENVDEISLILTQLNRYKHKSEWFKRVELLKIWESNTKRGEKNLSLNLYEFLFDQWVQFSIEPASASGEADLVSSQSGEDPLVADVKIFDPSKSKDKAYIAKGFRQVYDYTRDYNEPVGYLVIFKTSADNLSFDLPTTLNKTPYVRHNNKTIYFILVDIHAYENTASQRGKLKVVKISESDLIEELSGS